MITLDTSGVLALLNSRDPAHRSAKAALERAGRPYLLPVGTLSEIAYLLEARMPDVIDVFLADIDTGAFSQDCGENQLPRVRELVERYKDLSLGHADAAVIACAGENGGLVLTFDRRDFGVVAREGTITITPD